MMEEKLLGFSQVNSWAESGPGCLKSEEYGPGSAVQARKAYLCPPVSEERARANLRRPLRPIPHTPRLILTVW